MKFLWILSVLLAGCNGSTSASPSKAPVTVFAAASLREAISEIAEEWERVHDQPVRLQCGASSTLARQIQEGAEAAIFISAAPEWLDAVRPAERVDWLGNRLVCVVHRTVTAFELKSAKSLALANERVPAGKYARAALESLGIALPARVIYGADVRDVLSKVSEGGAEAGIVYATDAAVDPDLRVAYTFPLESHPPIVYSVGLLRPAGKALFTSLREPWARDVAHKLGFAVLP